MERKQITLPAAIAALTYHLGAISEKADNCREITDLCLARDIHAILNLLKRASSPVSSADDLQSIIEEMRAEYMVCAGRLTTLSALLKDFLSKRGEAIVAFEKMPEKPDLPDTDSPKNDESAPAANQTGEKRLCPTSASKNAQPSYAGITLDEAITAITGQVNVMHSSAERCINIMNLTTTNRITNLIGMMQTMAPSDADLQKVKDEAGFLSFIGQMHMGYLTCGDELTELESVLIDTIADCVKAEKVHEELLSEIKRMKEYKPGILQMPKRPTLPLSIRSIVQPTIAAAEYHSVGLRKDGTVVAVGLNSNHQCDVGSWRDIVAVAAGNYHTVGLKRDGTVVAIGGNRNFDGKYVGQCHIDSWRDIVAIAAGTYHTVGLKKDGTVVAVGDNSFGICNVGSWHDIVAIAAGHHRTIGLMKDGTCVAVGDNDQGRCNVGLWREIVAVEVGCFQTFGLKKDGTVVTVGKDTYETYDQSDVTSWREIVAIAAGYQHVVGLKKDGTVVAAGNVNALYGYDEWRDIVAIIAGWHNIIGLKKDGTVVAVGGCTGGDCDMSDWRDIRLPKNV